MKHTGSIEKVVGVVLATKGVTARLYVEELGYYMTVTKKDLSMVNSRLLDCGVWVVDIIEIPNGREIAYMRPYMDVNEIPF